MSQSKNLGILQFEAAKSGLPQWWVKYGDRRNLTRSGIQARKHRDLMRNSEALTKRNRDFNCFT